MGLVTAPAVMSYSNVYHLTLAPNAVVLLAVDHHLAAVDDVAAAAVAAESFQEVYHLKYAAAPPMTG